MLDHTRVQGLYLSSDLDPYEIAQGLYQQINPLTALAMTGKMREHTPGLAALRCCLTNEAFLRLIILYIY